MTNEMRMVNGAEIFPSRTAAIWDADLKYGWFAGAHPATEEGAITPQLFRILSKVPPDRNTFWN